MATWSHFWKKWFVFIIHLFLKLHDIILIIYFVCRHDKAVAKYTKSTKQENDILNIRNKSVWQVLDNTKVQLNTFGYFLLLLWYWNINRIYMIYKCSYFPMTDQISILVFNLERFLSLTYLLNVLSICCRPVITYYVLQFATGFCLPIICIDTHWLYTTVCWHLNVFWFYLSLVCCLIDLRLLFACIRSDESPYLHIRQQNI